MSEPRKNRPRPALVMRPSFVSNETCFAVLGVVPRKFREHIVPRCGQVTWIGRTVLVELDEAERVVLAMAGNESTSDEPESVADVLALLGKETIGPEVADTASRARKPRGQ